MTRGLRRRPARVLVDSGFIIALYSSLDPKHERALEVFEELHRSACSWYIPWPTLYESIKRRVTYPTSTAQLKRDWETLERAGRLERLDDTKWREEALQTVLASRSVPVRNARAISLVDEVLRAVIRDELVGIGRVVTNDRDDLVAVCMACGVDLIVI